MTAPIATDAAVEKLIRRAVGTALIQSGWMDRDDPDESDLLAFQNCDGCEQTRCPCTGVPFLSSLIWDQIDKFGDLTRAFELIRRHERERIAAAAETADSEDEPIIIDFGHISQSDIDGIRALERLRIKDISVPLDDDGESTLDNAQAAPGPVEAQS